MLKVDEGTAHVFRTSVGKTVQIDIADTVWTKTIVRQIRQGYRPSGYSHLHLLTCRRALYLQNERCAWVSAQMGAYITGVLVCHRCIVDAQYYVALLQSGFRSRTAFVRLINDNSAKLHVLTYHSSYTDILSGHHLLELVHLALRIILSVWVERVQHPPYTCADDLVGIQRVYIYHIEVTIDIVEDLDIL